MQRQDCLKGTITGSVQATDRLMKELKDIFRSASYKDRESGQCNRAVAQKHIMLEKKLPCLQVLDTSHFTAAVFQARFTIPIPFNMYFIGDKNVEILIHNRLDWMLCSNMIGSQ